VRIASEIHLGHGAGPSNSCSSRACVAPQSQTTSRGRLGNGRRRAGILTKIPGTFTKNSRHANGRRRLVLKAKTKKKTFPKIVSITIRQKTPSCYLCQTLPEFPDAEPQKPRKTLIVLSIAANKDPVRDFCYGNQNNL
jgi:hypothetical protein